MQDELLDAGARDKLNRQQDTFLANILTLGALPIAGGPDAILSMRAPRTNQLVDLCT